MIERLRAAQQEGRTISGADASFYMHELTEATLMEGGMDYEAAHDAALAKYGVDPRSVYHPDVIRQFPDRLNDSWFRFWGIER